MFNTDVTPVQMIFLRKPSKMTIGDAFGFIIRDLVIRKVLRFTRNDIYPTERSKKPQKYYYLSRGVNFVGYEPLPYEINIISPFEDVDKIQLKTITNFILRKYGMPTAYIADKIYLPLKKEGYVSSLPLLKAFGYYKPTNKGKQLVADFENFISEKENSLQEYIDSNNNDDFINTLKDTGTYVFSFEKNNPELYKSIISKIKDILASSPTISDSLLEYYEASNINFSYFEEA